MNLKSLLAAVCAAALCAGSAGTSAEPLASPWRFSGKNLSNTGKQNRTSGIDRENVRNLEVKWAVDLDGTIPATAAVENGAVYIPDSGGSLHRLDAATGATVWSSKVSDYTGIEGDFARVTPAIWRDILVIGNQAGRNNSARVEGMGGAQVVGVNKADGTLAWSTEVDAHPRAVITASPVVYRGVAYVGVASLEEDGDPACCTFVGSVVALDASNGNILWQTKTAPDGYYGNAVWASAPVVDRRRGRLYVVTGNNYLIPGDVLACVEDKLGEFDADDYTLGDRDRAMQAVRGCYAGDDFDKNWFNSVVALYLRDGSVAWTTKTLPFDAWTATCFFGEDLPGCQGGPDYDFGQGPMLYTARSLGRQLLAVGQKSGDFWGLEPDYGQVVWKSKIAPGSEFAGGLMWGAATDGRRIYTGANTAFSAGFPPGPPKPWTLQGGGNDGQTIRHGFWNAISAASGQIEWQVPDLSMAGDISRVTVTRGVVFAGSLGTPSQAGGAASDPTMVALNSRTGEVLWTFASGGSVISAPAIVDGVVYWGSGYEQFGAGTLNTTFYAFAPAEPD